MKLSKIINAREVISNISDQQSIGTNLAYWMTKFISKTENEYEFYVAEMCKIIEKYAQSAEGGEMRVPADRMPQFNTDVELLTSTEVEDPLIRFKLSELSASTKLSMKQMYHLLDFIDEER